MILKVNANKSESESKTLSEGEEGSESSGSNSGLGSLENSREDSGGTGKSNHQVSFSTMYIAHCTLHRQVKSPGELFSLRRMRIAGAAAGGISLSQNMF